MIFYLAAKKTAEFTLISVLSKTRKNFQLILPCFVVYLLEVIISQGRGIENLSLTICAARRRRRNGD